MDLGDPTLRPCPQHLDTGACPPVLRPCSPPRWALPLGAGRPCHAAAQARRRWTCRSVLLSSAVAVPRWSRWTWSRGGGGDDARLARVAVIARVVGRGGASEAVRASGAGEVVGLSTRNEPGCPSPPSQPCPSRRPSSHVYSRDARSREACLLAQRAGSFSHGAEQEVHEVPEGEETWRVPSQGRRAASAM